jgi:hypothetical protein
LTEFVADVGPIIVIIVGIAGLGGYMYKIGKWINEKAEEKAEVLKKQTEEYARNLRKQTEEYATNLKANQELIAAAISKIALDTATSVAKVATDTAYTLKQNNESIATDLKQHNERIAVSLKDNNEHTTITLKGLLTESTDKLNELLSNLRERADLTNGNVAAIRTDVQDLKEDLQERDDIDQEEREQAAGYNYSDSTLRSRKATRRNRVTRNRDDANKRRRIETDRRSQEH